MNPEEELPVADGEPSPAPAPRVPAAGATAAAWAAAVLAACGGGGGGGAPSPGPSPSPSPSPSPGPSPSPSPTPSPPASAPLTANEASRLLSQAAFGGTEADVQHLRDLGASAWLDEQFTIAGNQGHWDWMVASGYAVTANQDNFNGVDATIWRRLMTSPDMLRQRVALAWSEIFVVSMLGIPETWRGMAVAAYVDLLTDNAFANFRTLLEKVTLSPAMGVYLNMRGNQKEDSTGRQPDENYAREVMQLFTIGLYELNADGTVKLTAGQPVETYTQSTVSALAKVFTGWEFDNFVRDVPDHMRRPMQFISVRHSTAAKSFLGVNIAAGSTDGAGELKQALDALANHANTGPFISRQLIQRLVTSNPSAAYVGRVAAVFADNGSGVRGDMKAVVRAILMDAEARTPATASTGGKLREPIARLVQWGRTFKASSSGNLWNIGDTSDPSSRLGQSPLRSPSVFNFFRPGYVPPSTAIGALGLTAPELQITNESTVVGYANWMQTVIQTGRGDVTGSYIDWLAGSTDAAALFDRMNTVFAAGQLGTAAKSTIVTALTSIDASTDAGKLRRVQAAALLVMVAPEYLVLK